LAPGRWRPEVGDALERLLEYGGEGTPDYSVFDPPVAVFVWDDVAMTHDPGQALFYRMVTRVRFKFSESFWTKIPEQYGRLRIRAAHAAFQERLAKFDAESESLQKDILRVREEGFGLPRTDPRFETLGQELSSLRQQRLAVEARRTAALAPLLSSDPDYRAFRKGMLRCYQSICAEQGGKVCASWLVGLLAGFEEEELQNLSRVMIDSEFKRTVGSQLVKDALDDPDPVRFPVGLRGIPEMADLFRQLRKKGFDVWVLSTTNEWTIKLLTQMYGVHQSRTVGIRSQVSEGRVTDNILEPIPFGTGQAAAVTFFIGRPPALVVGGERDEPILDYGRGVRIVMAARGADPASWRKRGWLVQPKFSPDRAPQEFRRAAEGAVREAREIPEQPAVEEGAPLEGTSEGEGSLKE